ncbi:hypothetical protein GCM10009605_51880 [Nocardiopsis composta]
MGGPVPAGDGRWEVHGKATGLLRDLAIHVRSPHRLSPADGGTLIAALSAAVLIPLVLLLLSTRLPDGSVRPEDGV